MGWAPVGSEDARDCHPPGQFPAALPVQVLVGLAEAGRLYQLFQQLQESKARYGRYVRPVREGGKSMWERLGESQEQVEGSQEQVEGSSSSRQLKRSVVQSVTDKEQPR